MKKLLLFLTALLAGNAYAADHMPARIGAITMHAESIGVGRPIILGDSNTEGMWWNHVCNSNGWVINAGVGGAKVWDLVSNMYLILPPTLPSVATLMIGTNDAAASQVGTWEEQNWEANYEILVNMLRGWNVTPTLFTIPPVEQGKTLGEGYFLTSQIQRFNAHIRTVATNYGLPLKDIYATMANSSGYMPAGGTKDGVHLSSAKRADYYYMVEDGIRKALLSEGASCP